MKRATVVDGRMPHALLLEMFTTEGTGTMVVPAATEEEGDSTMTRTEELAARWSAVMMSNYKTPPVALARGEGATVWDVDGREYTDLLGGIATTILGHAHPKVVEAITAQAHKLGHVSNLAMHEPGAAAGRAAARPRRPARARLLLQLRRRGQRDGLQDQPAHRPARGDHRRGRLPRPDHGRAGAHRSAVEGRGLRPAARRRAVRALRGRRRAGRRRCPTQTAMVLLEPMLGEGGVLPAPAGYLAAAAAAAARAPARCSPSTRCRPAWAAPAPGSCTRPTACSPTSSPWPRRWAAGCRWARLLAFGEAADLLTAGAHGSTFGGNPIAAAAALAVLDTIRDEGLLERAKELEHRFTAGIEGARPPRHQRRPGRGARCSASSSPPTSPARWRRNLRAAGFLTNAVAPGVLRLAPPLVLTDAQVDAFVAALPAALDTVDGDAS